MAYLNLTNYYCVNIGNLTGVDAIRHVQRQNTILQPVICRAEVQSNVS